MTVDEGPSPRLAFSSFATQKGLQRKAAKKAFVGPEAREKVLDTTTRIPFTAHALWLWRSSATATFGLVFHVFPLAADEKD